MMKAIKYSIFFFVFLVVVSCEDDNYVPKPVGFARIDFKDHKYKDYNDDCPFEFQYGSMAQVVQVNGKRNATCWFNLEYPQLKAKVHFSYLKIEGENIDGFTKDARKLALEHLAKADDFEENIVQDTAENVYGIIYDFKGSTASNMQFYLTDSVNHFVRGALYFEVTPKADSIAPTEAYIEEELQHLINTFTWK